MRSFKAKAPDNLRRTVMRVSSVEDAVSEWNPGAQFLCPVLNSDDANSLKRLFESGVDNLYAIANENTALWLRSDRVLVGEQTALMDGDVVVVSGRRTRQQIVFRESDLHTSIFLTNRCNSNCIMCSQPPTKADDSWLTQEALAIADHMRLVPKVLGFTGGEPSILGKELLDIIQHYRKRDPEVSIEILSNGRKVGEQGFMETVLSELQRPVSWMIPLYGHTGFYHDAVVQVEGAFEETLAGILALHKYGQRIQIRVVLIPETLDVLSSICEFISFNLPFVEDVALMGCEPFGLAMAYPERCKTDIENWQGILREAVNWLERGNIAPVVMNVPICALPEHLRCFSSKSISDWKQVYLGVCQNCRERESCCGFFESSAKGWLPSKVVPFE